MVWRVLIGLGLAAGLAWLLLLVVLARAALGAPLARESLRLLPDVLRLLRRLVTDRALPWGVRVRLLLALAYLASPLDLVPDFLPVIGFADDAIVVAAVLRSVVRRAGPQAVRDHWPGTPAGLEALWRAARLPGQPGEAGLAGGDGGGGAGAPRPR